MKCLIRYVLVCLIAAIFMGNAYALESREDSLWNAYVQQSAQHTYCYSDESVLKGIDILLEILELNPTSWSAMMAATDEILQFAVNSENAERIDELFVLYDDFDSKLGGIPLEQISLSYINENSTNDNEQALMLFQFARQVINDWRNWGSSEYGTIEEAEVALYMARDLYEDDLNKLTIDLWIQALYFQEGMFSTNKYYLVDPNIWEQCTKQKAVDVWQEILRICEGNGSGFECDPFSDAYLTIRKSETHALLAYFNFNACNYAEMKEQIIRLGENLKRHEQQREIASLDSYWMAQMYYCHLRMLYSEQLGLVEELQNAISDYYIAHENLLNGNCESMFYDPTCFDDVFVSAQAIIDRQ